MRLNGVSTFRWSTPTTHGCGSSVWLQSRPEFTHSLLALAAAFAALPDFSRLLGYEVTQVMMGPSRLKRKPSTHEDFAKPMLDKDQAFEAVVIISERERHYLEELQLSTKLQQRCWRVRRWSSNGGKKEITCVLFCAQQHTEGLTCGIFHFFKPD